MGKLDKEISDTEAELEQLKSDKATAEANMPIITPVEETEEHTVVAAKIAELTAKIKQTENNKDGAVKEYSEQINAAKSRLDELKKQRTKIEMSQDTADAIIGAGGEVVATGGDLALASSGLSAGAAAGMTAAMVLPVALMTWDQSGLNPKNYTVGKKNEVAWQKSGLNPADYGVDPQKTSPISDIAAIVTSLVVWWKNNSFTKTAIQADDVLKKLKEAQR